MTSLGDQTRQEQMDFYIIDTLGNLDDKSLCILTTVPKGMGLKGARMGLGKKVGSAYPRNAKIHMSDEYLGIKLASLIGNTKSLFIVSSEVKEAVEAACAGVEVEYFPFTLINHKGREHSTDYFIISPIGSIDCLNLDASDIEYLKGEVVGVDQFVLDPEKVQDAPALFRVPQDKREYFVRGDLVETLQERGFTNLKLRKVTQVERKENA